jgi:hypothetical protein
MKAPEEESKIVNVFSDIDDGRMVGEWRRVVLRLAVATARTNNKKLIAALKHLETHLSRPLRAFIWSPRRYGCRYLRAATLFSIATASQELLPPAVQSIWSRTKRRSLLPPKAVTGFAKPLLWRRNLNLLPLHPVVIPLTI